MDETRLTLTELVDSVAVEFACQDLWGEDFQHDKEQMYAWMDSALRTAFITAALLKGQKRS